MKSRLIDEISTIGKLEDYRNTLEDILVLIHNDGCRVSTRYDVVYSNIGENLEYGRYIQVSLKNVSKPLDIIWKLLHEYGHYLSGVKESKDFTIEREVLAWDNAEKMVMTYPDLVAKIWDFNQCKMECLDSYRRMNGNLL